MKNHRNSLGFTLIELLVVIMIILLLAAILFPVFAAAREKAIQNNCLSNLKNLSTGVQLFITQNDNMMLSTGGTTNVYSGGPGNSLTTFGNIWYDRLMPYIGTVPPISPVPGVTSADLSKFPGILSCPGVTELAVGYGLNIYASKGAIFNTQAQLLTSLGGGQTGCNLSMMKTPATTIYFCEAGIVPVGVGAGARGDPNGPTEWIETIPALPITNPPTTRVINNITTQAGIIPRCRIGATFNDGTSLIYVPRHNGATNCLMVDGHVKAYSIKALDKWQYRATFPVTAPIGQYDTTDTIPHICEPGCPWDNVSDENDDGRGW